MVKVIFFDLVGTLTGFYYEDYVWKEAIPQLYARKRGVCFEEARDYVLSEYDRIGNKDIRWYLPEYWFKYLNLDEDSIEVFRTHTDKVAFYPEVPLVLKRLSQKYDLILVSGTTRAIIETTIETFRHYFKHIYSPVSDRHEVKKTPQFYEMICKNLEIRPCVMAHVGDEWYSDYVFPRRIGIKSFYLDRTGEKTGEFVVKDLKELEGCWAIYEGGENCLSDENEECEEGIL